METIEKKQLRRQTFGEDVKKGLTDFPKHLSSKYIYDKIGDGLFQEIMELEEYYLTRCEMEIISSNKQVIGELFRDRENGLDLIELGAGDGKKTKVLLNYMLENNFNFIYKPVDISESALKSLINSLKEEMPALEVRPTVGEYFEALDRLRTLNSRKKVILFLGSNVGNLPHPAAIKFLEKLEETLTDEDLAFIGMDQKKDPQTIQNAYNDSLGVTEKFNLNLLRRINRELGGNFDVSKFTHWETYNPETGTAKSFLIATEAMNVEIKALDLKIHFDQWETIHTEISQKYDDKTVQWMAQTSGLKIVTAFTDSKGYFRNYVFRRKGNLLK